MVGNIKHPLPLVTVCIREFNENDREFPPFLRTIPVFKEFRRVTFSITIKLGVRPCRIRYFRIRTDEPLPLRKHLPAKILLGNAMQRKIIQLITFQRSSIKVGPFHMKLHVTYSAISLICNDQEPFLFWMPCHICVNKIRLLLKLEIAILQSSIGVVLPSHFHLSETRNKRSRSHQCRNKIDTRIQQFSKTNRPSPYALGTNNPSQNDVSHRHPPSKSQPAYCRPSPESGCIGTICNRNISSTMARLLHEICVSDFINGRPPLEQVIRK